MPFTESPSLGIPSPLLELIPTAHSERYDPALTMGTYCLMAGGLKFHEENRKWKGKRKNKVCLETQTGWLSLTTALFVFQEESLFTKVIFMFFHPDQMHESQVVY